MKQGLLRAKFALTFTLGTVALFWVATVAIAQSPSTANFLVNARSDELAVRVAANAEQLRKQIAVTWLGEELQNTSQRSLIYAKVSETRSVGRTLLGEARGGHFVSLVGPVDQVTGSLLAHEVAHTVFAARFGKSMPVWANEGIASLYDDDRRHAIRRGILSRMAAEQDWPQLGPILQGLVRTQRTYTTVASLTQFLLTRSEPTEFIQFVESGARRGWEQALRSHYGIQNVEELQLAWQAWVKRDALLAAGG